MTARHRPAALRLGESAGLAGQNLNPAARGQCLTSTRFPDGSDSSAPPSWRRTSWPAARARPSTRASLLGARRDDLDPAQPAGARGRRGRPGRAPGVQPDVVVVAAGRDEERAGVPAHRRLEAEDARPEGLGLGDVAHLQVHVPHRRSLRHALVGRAGHLPEDPLDVEGKGGHSQLAVVVGPLVAGAVAVDLDAVALGVVQVEGLAHEVVGGAGEGRTRVEDAAERPRELGPARHEDRQVEEPGARPGPRGRARPSLELDERGAACGAEPGDPVALVEHTQPQRALVEGPCPIEAGDGQPNRTHSGGGIDGSVHHARFRAAS